MEASFFTIAPEESDFPDVEDILEYFSKVYDERGRPDVDNDGGYALDIMMIEVCMHFNITFAKANDSCFIFHSLDIDKNAVDDVVKKINSGDYS